ncbi:MAG: hypothetical protein ABI824_20265 [Acidobacteriota bacterium]
MRLSGWMIPAAQVCLAVCSFAQAPTQTPQTPAPQQPAGQSTTPQTAGRAPVQPVAPREAIDDMLSISLYYWKPKLATPGYYGGRLSTDPTEQRLDFPDSPNHATGFVATLPTGGANHLELGMFSVGDSGTFRPTTPLLISGGTFPVGELLAMQYSIKNYRITWNYLTFPVPAFGAKLRIKTLWEFQYNSIRPTIFFPESTIGAGPLANRYSVKWPGAGLGFEYVLSKRFRAEGRFTGMGFPHRSSYWDTDVSAVARFGSVEVYGGLKMYHFSTSPQKDVYFKSTFGGPLVGIRYVIH